MSVYHLTICFSNDVSGVLFCRTCTAVMFVDLPASKTVNIEKRFVEIEDHGIKLRLTIVDTPGFNDAVDASQRYDMLMHFTSGHACNHVCLFNHSCSGISSHS